MDQMYRTHWVADCINEAVGQQVVLNGWVQRRRDLGGLIFLDLRDRSGVIQVVLNPAISPEAVQIADGIRNEYVISVTGKIASRAKEQINFGMETGEIEIVGEQIHLFNPSKTPPFSLMGDIDVDEGLRLKYRYLDLRRAKMQRNLRMRHQAMQWIRQFLDQRNFMEVDTPMLTRSTPEGARDYLVPSRVQKGSFYALPQSPQLFKQLLMVSGIERYFQFARCFRDEDLRADRQPEFTQLDMEVSFQSVESLMQLVEEMMAGLFHALLGVEVKLPLSRMSYATAMERYGSDKPDLRFKMELVDVSKVFQDSSFQVFRDTLESGGQIKAINAKGCATWSRKEIDQLGKEAAKWGAKGLAWLAFTEENMRGSFIKFISEEQASKLRSLLEVTPGDLLLFVADQPEITCRVLGELRLHLARQLQLMDPSTYSFVWITDFPLFEYSEEDQRFYSVHHPFTAPKKEDIPLLSEKPEQVRAQAYDLVLNGFELGGGSQRIYQREIQQQVFKVLGLSKEDAKEQFGFLLDAFEYGTPPHLGIAFGFDRIMMLLLGNDNLRESIPFPKTSSAQCLMTKAPSPIDPNQLEQLHIRLDLG